MEEIYMHQPEGFIIEGPEDKICKLVKFLYKIKQASKMWHEKFDKVIRSNDYWVSKTDKCIYTKFGDGIYVIACLYVDSMLILGTNIAKIIETQNFLSSKFIMTDLGEANIILGIKIVQKEKGLALSQDHYIKKMLFRYEN